MSEFEELEEDVSQEMSPEDISEVNSLTNPDEDNSNEKYQWNEDFQKNIIGLLLNDRWFAVQCRDLIRPSYFVDERHQLICRILFRYLDTYNLLPNKVFVLEEVKQSVSKRSEDIVYNYISETELIYKKYVPGLDSREYLIDKIINFSKLMALKSAFDSSLTLIKKDPESEDTWLKIQSTLKEALLIDRNFEEGLDYFSTFEERYERMKKNEEALERFTSGFKAIDDALLGGGTHRGEIYSWIGLSGSGKSLALVTAALRNVTELNKRVLYVSLEMDEDKIAERFDAQISGVDINSLQEKRDIVKKAFEETTKDKDEKKMLVIKQFSAGTMTVNTLRAYLQQLRMIGFSPDLVVIDYIGEMKDYPGMPTYESRYRIVRDLRGLATDENICIYTAMQPNKNAREAQKKDGLGDGVIDDTNLADSYGQIRPLDGCWSINQMQAEKDGGIARIFVIKHRHGRSRFTFHVQFNKETLAMTQISAAKYNDLWKKVSFEKVDKQVDVDIQAENLRKFNEIQKKKNKKVKFEDAGYDDPDSPDVQPELPEDYESESEETQEDSQEN